MILQTLTRYYDRLLADPAKDIAPIGFSRQKISFCITLESDGRLHAFEQVGIEEKGRLRPEPLVVPGQSKPTGQGINPCFLWDNATYMLGKCPEGRDPDWARIRYEAFRKRHLDLEDTIDDDVFRAVCLFLRDWTPDSVAEHPELDEIAQSFGVFRVRAKRGYAHERPAITAYWNSQLQGDEDVFVGPCLVSGKRAPIARLHEPKIKGVIGGQSAGGLLVSFNDDAYTSYGKSQSHNAPVSGEAAFKYATALNSLLSERSRRVVIGDTTVVYWTEQPSKIEAFFGPAIDSQNAEDDTMKEAVKGFLQRLRQGKAAPEDLGDPATPFYVLGLAANAARISVRFWLMSTIGELHMRLMQHVKDLEIVGFDPHTPPPVVRELLLETAREAKDIPPLLGGALMRAILIDSLYPEALYGAVLRRIRADRRITTRRAAILKACLLRKYRQQPSLKEVPVSLNVNHPEPAYHVGRLFALLEKVQTDALPSLNDTIKDRFFSAASATPATVFPRLIRMSQHHQGKIDKKFRIGHERRLQQVVERIDRFPSHLNLEQQGLFAIGYYHQRQDLFTKKNNSEPENQENTE